MSGLHEMMRGGALSTFNINCGKLLQALSDKNISSDEV